LYLILLTTTTFYTETMTVNGSLQRSPHPPRASSQAQEQNGKSQVVGELFADGILVKDYIELPVEWQNSASVLPRRPDQREMDELPVIASPTSSISQLK
jgi:hypothetical protein